MSNLAERDMSRYLEDHLIRDHLARIDGVIRRYQSARKANNYDNISFALGELAGLTSLVYARNAQLDLGRTKEGEHYVGGN